MYHVLCHVGPGAGLLSRTPFIPMRDKGAIVRHSFLSVGKYHHPSSKALEGGWWGILKEELWFFEGHSQAALWGGGGPALAITTHKSPLGLRELGRHPHLTPHKCAGGSKERANCAWSVVISSTGHWGAAACSDSCPHLLRQCRAPEDTGPGVSRCVLQQGEQSWGP